LVKTSCVLPYTVAAKYAAGSLLSTSNSGEPDVKLSVELLNSCEYFAALSPNRRDISQSSSSSVYRFILACFRFTVLTSLRPAVALRFLLESTFGYLPTDLLLREAEPPPSTLLLYQKVTKLDNVRC
jgi:hypothetical protein